MHLRLFNNFQRTHSSLGIEHVMLLLKSVEVMDLKLGTVAQDLFIVDQL